MASARLFEHNDFGGRSFLPDNPGHQRYLLATFDFLNALTVTLCFGLQPLCVGGFCIVPDPFDVRRRRAAAEDGVRVLEVEQRVLVGDELRHDGLDPAEQVEAVVEEVGDPVVEASRSEPAGREERETPAGDTPLRGSWPVAQA